MFLAVGRLGCPHDVDEIAGDGGAFHVVLPLSQRELINIYIPFLPLLLFVHIGRSFAPRKVIIFFDGRLLHTTREERREVSQSVVDM